jgi:hypothetical protein
MHGIYGALTTLLHGALVRLFGPGVDQRVLGSITRADVGLSVCILALMLIVNGVAAAILRHKMRQTAAAADGRQLRHHTFGALS